ncbi:ankyrin repeat-containing domain protein [Xylariaceae sp. FL0804]|nr:ankyrin repeat-containing domain protein [Xylariaceae sp. FL0804]
MRLCPTLLHCTSSPDLLSSSSISGILTSSTPFFPDDRFPASPFPLSQGCAGRNMAASDWERHKAIIVHQYCIESLKLPEVVAYMKEKHNFDRKPHQYLYQLEKWDVKKKIPREVWLYVAHQLRKRGNKRSQVTIHGLKIPMDRISRALQRYATIPTAEEFGSMVHSPKAPEKAILHVSTPIIADDWYPCLGTLPWFKFLDNVQLVPPLPSQIMETLVTARDLSGVSLLSSIGATHSSLTSRIASNHPLDFYTRLNNLVQSIPMEHPEELDAAQVPLRLGDPSSIATTLLKVVFFHMSNNLHLLGGEFRSIEDMNLEDKFIISLVEVVLKCHPDMISQLLASPSPTSQAIKEKLFASAIRQGNGAISSQLLKAGVSPETAIVNAEGLICNFSVKKCLPSELLADLILSMKIEVKGYIRSPLEHCAANMDIELASVLLKAGAEVGTDGTTTILSIVASSKEHSRAMEFTKFLYNHGVKAHTAEPGAVAIARHNNTLAKFLFNIEGYPLVEGFLSRFRPHRFFYSQALSRLEKAITPLQVAIISCNTEMIDHILHIARCSPGPVSSSLREALFVASLLGDGSTVSKLLSFGFDLNVNWELGLTPLVASAPNPDVQVAKLLMAAGARPDALTGTSTRQAGYGLSAMHLAAFYGNSAMVELLLEHDADCRLRFDCPYELDPPEWPLSDFLPPERLQYATPLQLALESGDADTVRLILPHARLFGGEYTQALFLGDKSIISEVLSRKPDISSADIYGRTVTVTEAAAYTGDLDYILNYFRRGGEYSSRTLFYAAGVANASEDYSIVRVLAEHRPVGPIDSDEAFVLALAIVEDNSVLVDILLSHPFQPGPARFYILPEDLAKSPVSSLAKDSFYNDWLSTPVSVALENNRYLERLLEIGYPLQSDDLRAMSTLRLNLLMDSLTPEVMQPEVGRYLLYSAVTLGKLVTTRRLLEACGSCNFYTTDRLSRSQTPLQAAAERCNEPMVRLLLGAGADVNAPANIKSATALQYAAIHGSFPIVRLLLQHKANINASAASKEGRTALEGAAEHGRLDVVGFLLENGAQVDGVMRIHYVRAVMFALKHGHRVVADYLKERVEWNNEDEEFSGHRNILTPNVGFLYEYDGVGSLYDHAMAWLSNWYDTDEEASSGSSETSAAESSGLYENSVDEECTEPGLSRQAEWADSELENYVDSSLWTEDIRDGGSAVTPSPPHRDIISEARPDADGNGTFQMDGQLLAVVPLVEDDPFHGINFDETEVPCDWQWA